MSSSTPDNIIEDTVSAIHYEVKKHAQCLMEINSLTYEDFMDCLKKFNDMYVWIISLILSDMS